MPLPLLVVIGPSASGKSSRGARAAPARRRARAPDVDDATAPARRERRQRLEHRFVTDAMFDELDAAGFFLGTVVLPGLPYRYALPQRDAERRRTDRHGHGARPVRRSLRAVLPRPARVRDRRHASTARSSDSSSGEATRTRSTRASRATSPRSKPAAGSRRGPSSTTARSTISSDAIAASLRSMCRDSSHDAARPA